MIIAQISDTHLALDAPDAERRVRDFERTIADINALGPRPDAIVHTGDIVHNGRRDEYARAAAVLAKARAPVFVLPGNKDERANLREAFAAGRYFATDSDFLDYAVDRFPVRLIALDTKSARSNKGDFCPERIRRLADMIDADPGKPIAVFTHHPPFEVNVGPDLVHFETRDAMQALAQTLQRSGRVIAVFSGHVHRSVAGRVGAIPAIVMPCIATPLRRGEYSAPMQSRPVYHLHRFDPAWGFTTEARLVGAEPAAPSRRGADLPEQRRAAVLT